jgi:hypothetical protein
LLPPPQDGRNSNKNNAIPKFIRRSFLPRRSHVTSSKTPGSSSHKPTRRERLAVAEPVTVITTAAELPPGVTEVGTKLHVTAAGAQLKLTVPPKAVPTGSTLKL